MRKRVMSGIPGFDYVLNGGFLENTVNMVTGGPGAGKTIFALNYILRGAKDYNQNGLYITFEENWKNIKESLSPNLLRLYESTENMVHYLDLTAMRRVLGENYNLFDVTVLADMIEAIVKNNNIKRVAIDGISTMALKYSLASEYRDAFFKLGLLLKDLNVTTVITSEEEVYREFPFKEYLSDSITKLIYNGRKRRLRVMKMRGSDFISGLHGYKITDDGFVVYPRRVSERYKIVRDKRETISTGIRALDVILGGGYQRGDMIFIIGYEGTGKTTFAKHFAKEGGTRGERTLILSFQDPSRYLNLECVDILHYNPTEIDIYEIFEEIYTREYNRIIFDPLDSLFIHDVEEVQTLLQNTVLYLKNKWTTGIFVVNIPRYTGRFDVPYNITNLADTIILLRYEEINFEMKRLMSIIKSRELRYDTGLWEYTIRRDDIEIYGKVETYSK